MNHMRSISKKISFPREFLLGYTIGIAAVVLSIFAFYIYFFIVYGNDDDPKNWLPLINLYRSSDCIPKQGISRDKPDCNTGEIFYRFRPGDSIEQTLSKNLYYIDVNKDLTNENRVDFSSWRCREDGTQELIPLSTIAKEYKEGRRYLCWPGIVLDPNITIYEGQ